MIEGLQDRRPDASDLPDEALFLDALRPVLAAWNLTLSNDQVALLVAHFRSVVETNRVMNLTRIVSPAEAAVMHYADSLAIVVWAASVAPLAEAEVLDVGTGAGFPAIPMAVTRPDWRVTAMDGTGKKAAFVARTTEALGLKNLRAVHARADQIRPTSAYDLVVARAVARLDPLLGWLTPWTRVGGYVVAYKAARLSAEEGSAGEALAARLGLFPLPEFSYTLPHADGAAERRLLVYQRGESCRSESERHREHRLERGWRKRGPRKERQRGRR